MPLEQMTNTPLGARGAVKPRIEDKRFLRGEGTYSDDINSFGEYHAVMVRSPHAHANLIDVGVTEASVMNGVVAILTGQDYVEDGMLDLNHGANPAGAVSWQDKAFTNRDGSEPFEHPQPPIVREKVRHVGEVVAVVVANTARQAEAAAEVVIVDYEILPVVTDALAALEPCAPRIWKNCIGNIALDADQGDERAVAEVFQNADHIVEEKFINNRVVNCQMEPRAALGEWNPVQGKLTLYAGGQGVHRHKAILAMMFKLDPSKVRVVSKDVGGGFGPRNMLYPEFAIVCWAAKRIGQPVKWLGTRSEAFISDYQARDLRTHAALALDKNGKFLAVRAELIGNLGSHTVSFVPLSNGPRLLTSVYNIEACYARIRGVLTNTVPTGPYRGAGRPEAIHVTERLIDIASMKIGIDRIELRRRNLIPRHSFPVTNPMGTTYDSGEFENILDITTKKASWTDFELRRRSAAAAGKLRGIGYASYIQAPVGAPIEFADITVEGTGTAILTIGTQSSGQGHETVFSQYLAEVLGVPEEDVIIITGDSDAVAMGGGSHSDRSMRLGGIVIREAADELLSEGRKIASSILEVAPEDILFSEGKFCVTGTDKTVSLYNVAKASTRGSLSGDAVFKGRSAAFPNGAAVSEVEIDKETGELKIVAHTTVDDPGRAINAMILTGQAHGSIVQGVGQAVIENGVYDTESGQLITGSFLDYGLLRADDVPYFNTALHEVPTENNPLGVKGGGEGATVSATGALTNAVCDALKGEKITNIQMPITSEKLFWIVHNSDSPNEQD